MPDGNELQTSAIMAGVADAAVARYAATHPEPAHTPPASSSHIELSMTHKVFLALIIAGLMWMGATVQQTAVKVAVIESELKTTATDRYTGSEASRDLRRVDSDLEAIRLRLTALEGNQ